MTKAIYMGVDGVARKAKAMYVGVDGVARKVKKAYVGVDGVAKLFYQSEPQPLSQVTIKITNTVLGGTGVGIECIIPALGISAVSNGRAEAVFTQGKIMRGETYTVCAYRENGIEYKRQDFTAADADTDIWYLDVKSLVGEGPRLRVYTIDSTTGSVHTGNLVSGVPLEIVYAAGPSVPGFAEQTTGEDGSVQWSAMAPLKYGDYAIKVVENENWEESLFPFFWEDSDRTFLMLVTPKVKVDTLIVVKDYAGDPLSGVNVRINKTSIGVTDTAGTTLTRQSLGDNIEITLDLLGYTSVRTNVVIERGSPFQIDITMTRDVQIIFDSCGGSAISRIDTYQGATFNSFPTPAKDMYVFKGWYLDDALTEPVVYPFVVSSNTTLTAKWEEELKQYNITIDYDEGGNVTASHESAAYAGEELLFSAQPKIGFIFSKWEIYLEGNSIPEIKTDNPLTYIMPASDINFVPIFAEEGGGTGITYNIMMGIAIGGSASSNKDTAAEGEQVTFTAMPDVGSEFLNWEIMKDGETTPAIIIDNPLTYTMPACNIGVTPVFNEGSPPVPSDPITLVFKVTGTDSPPTGYTVRFTYPDGSLIFEGTTKALGTVRMNTADRPMYAVDGMTATATNGSYAGTITINAADVTEDKANPSSEILFDIPVITTGTLGSSNAKDAKTTITIPAGVNVIKFKDVYIGVTPNKTYNISKKSFALGSEFRLSVSSDTEGYWRETVYTTTVFNELTLSFEYSPAINSVTPTVTDY